MTTAVAGTSRAAKPLRGRPGSVVVACGLLVVLGAWLGIHLTMPGWYARLWYPLHHADAIRAEARAAGLPADLVAGVISRESGFSDGARSRRGAVGLMQVLPETAEWIHRQPGAPAPDPSRLAEPEVNIAYGVWYLHYLLDRYRDEGLVLAAYNGGETNLAGWIADAARRGVAFVPADIPFPETRSFVGAVRDARAVYRRAWGGALAEPAR